MDEIFTAYLEKIETEIVKALPEQSNSSWFLSSFGEEPPELTSDLVQPLLTPTRSLVDLGGKRWRPLLLVLCAKAKIEDIKDFTQNQKEDLFNKALKLAPIVEFVHTASLIHDDIEDGSDTRRNQPAAYITYGIDTAINSASWLYFEAATVIQNLSVPVELKEKLYTLYTMELRRLHLGQAMDICWHRNKGFLPTTAQYIAMVTNKTGTLASLAAKAGMMICGASEEDINKAGKAAALTGAGFQIIDDVINLSTGNPGKKRGDDIVEGKKSLPVLLFAEKYKDNKEKLLELETLFKQAELEGINSSAVEKAIELLSSVKAIEEAREIGKNYIYQGCKMFSELFTEENSFAKKINTLFTSMIPVIL